MSRGHAYRGPDMTTSEGKAGLSQRLSERRQEFWIDGKRVSLPVEIYPKWVSEKRVER